MEDKQNQQPTQPVETTNPTPPVVTPAPITPTVPEAPKTKAKFTDLLKDIYTNIKGKRVFKLLIVLFGVMVFIIILGTIYSFIKNSNKKQAVSVSPSPQPTAQIILTEESKKSQSILEELKTRILNLDVYQKHLTPPTVDFDISF